MYHINWLISPRATPRTQLDWPERARTQRQKPPRAAQPESSPHGLLSARTTDGPAKHRKLALITARAFCPIRQKRTRKRTYPGTEQHLQAGENPAWSRTKRATWRSRAKPSHGCTPICRTKTHQRGPTPELRYSPQYTGESRQSRFEDSRPLRIFQRYGKSLGAISHGCAASLLPK